MWEQISVVGGALVVLTTLVVMLFKLNKLSYTLGQMQQSITDKIDVLERGGAQRDSNAAKVLEDLNRHCGSSGLHVNAELERRTYEEGREWRKSVDGKLNELLKSNK